MSESITVYVIRTEDNYFFTGRYNQFVEPVFDWKITDSRFYADKGVAEVVLKKMKEAIKGNELETHYPSPKIYKVNIELTK